MLDTMRPIVFISAASIVLCAVVPSCTVYQRSAMKTLLDIQKTTKKGLPDYFEADDLRHAGQPPQLPRDSDGDGRPDYLDDFPEDPNSVWRRGDNAASASRPADPARNGIP